MLVEHIQFSFYPFVHVRRWMEISGIAKLNVGRAKDATDDVLSKRRDAWNRLTVNLFNQGDWGAVCEWVKESLDVLDARDHLLIEEQGDAVSELMMGAIEFRRTAWERFKDEVELSMMEDE